MERIEYYLIEYYVYIPDLIAKLTHYKQDISKLYYENNSLIPCNIFVNDITIDSYQRVLNPERIAMMLYDEERSVSKRITRLKRKYSLFCEAFTHAEINELRNLKTCSYPLKFKAMEQINEVNFYLEQHNKQMLKNDEMEHRILGVTQEVNSLIEDLSDLLGA